MNGYLGKILQIDLTMRDITIIPTLKYQHWGGGHGMGSAIFWDLVKDKAISGFDPANVVTIMTSPLTGTLAPAASARTEMQGIGIQSYPVEWFTRSNFGGRFGPMLKYAGWDGIVICGRADKPVWVDIRDDAVKIKDAKDLWGKDTWKTQEEIWQKVSGSRCFNNWIELGLEDDGRRTTQRSAVLTIGPAGENLSRMGAIIHDAGNAAGQGGFGGVWGSKNLKAISVLGTGSIGIADPNALMEARLWAAKYFTKAHDNLTDFKIDNAEDIFGFDGLTIPMTFWKNPKKRRPQACTGCHSGCRARHESGFGNESGCAETAFYTLFDLKKHANIVVRAISGIFRFLGLDTVSEITNLAGKQTSAAFKATDLLQKYGINAFEMLKGLPYLRDLNKMGVLGPEKAIICDLPFDKLGEFEFAEKLLKMIAFRKGIGDDIAEGFYRAAKRWGRLKKDTATGLLDYPHWGLPGHYDPRLEMEWGYGSILGDRDICEHCINILFFMPSTALWIKKKPPISAEEVTKIFSEKMMPYEGDPAMLDFSTENIYSEQMAKLVSWHRHYTRFWKQSILYCDFRFPDIYNSTTLDNRGLTGEGEQTFYNAVTGENISFTDGMELGRKIWNLDNAIWTLQGRHRDMVHFADYIYNVPLTDIESLEVPLYMPGKKDGKWEYLPLNGRSLDKAKFEEWKTKYYRLEGWDSATGWPKKETLESLDLEYIAKELEEKGKLGRG